MNVHTTVCAPAPLTGIDTRSHSCSPKMTATSSPSTETVSVSYPVSDDTFHQNESVPAPETVVVRRVTPPLPTAPLRAALSPTTNSSVCSNQGASPSVPNTRAALSSVAPDGLGSGVHTA